jgi:hypothetical protein
MTATVQLMTTLVLGGVAAYIAWRQWRTAHDRLVLDLFERRFQVFQELTRAILAAFNKPNAEIDDLAKFDIASEKARFLFEPEVREYLIEVRKHLINIITKGRALAEMPDGSARTMAENELVAGLTEMHAFYDKLAVMVTPYLQMTTRS